MTLKASVRDYIYKWEGIGEALLQLTLEMGMGAAIVFMGYVIWNRRGSSK